MLWSWETCIKKYIQSCAAGRPLIFYITRIVFFNKKSNNLNFIENKYFSNKSLHFF